MFSIRDVIHQSMDWNKGENKHDPSRAQTEVQ